LSEYATTLLVPSAVNVVVYRNLHGACTTCRELKKKYEKLGSGLEYIRLSDSRETD
jgi:hypothetical protein